MFTAFKQNKPSVTLTKQFFIIFSVILFGHVLTYFNFLSILKGSRGSGKFILSTCVRRLLELLIVKISGLRVLSWMSIFTDVDFLFKDFWYAGSFMDVDFHRF